MTPFEEDTNKECEDCEWLKNNIEPLPGIYEKCANGHTFPAKIQPLETNKECVHDPESMTKMNIGAVVNAWKIK